jgi:hypothetical protein
MAEKWKNLIQCGEKMEKPNTVRQKYGKWVIYSELFSSVQ